MNTTKTQTNEPTLALFGEAVDQVAVDFKHSVLVVSLLVNLGVFVTWLTVAISA